MPLKKNAAKASLGCLTVDIQKPSEKFKCFRRPLICQALIAVFEYHAYCVRRFFRQIFIVFRIDVFFQPASTECGSCPFGEAVIGADGDVFVVFRRLELLP